MSFDPQNPRGSSSPTTPSPTPTSPTSSKQPGYIPPQPVSGGPSRNVIIAVGAVIAVLLVGIVVLLILNLLKGSPTASPAPSASTPAAQVAPTTAGSQRPTSAPSSASLPPASPSLRPTPGGSLVEPSAGTPEAALLGHVPDAVRTTCSSGVSTDGAALALVNCVPSATVAVTYTQYADANGMDAAYEQIFDALEIDKDSGSCEDHTTWPAESSYSVDGQPVGRRVCIDANGSATIYWTDDRLLILSTANSASADADALLAFWTTEAGPIP